MSRSRILERFNGFCNLRFPEWLLLKPDVLLPLHNRCPFFKELSIFWWLDIETGARQFSLVETREKFDYVFRWSMNVSWRYCPDEKRVADDTLRRSALLLEPSQITPDRTLTESAPGRARRTEVLQFSFSFVQYRYLAALFGPRPRAHSLKGAFQ